MSHNAIQKKLAKKFKVGDVVTWGRKRIAHRIVEVRSMLVRLSPNAPIGSAWMNPISVIQLGLIRQEVHDIYLLPTGWHSGLRSVRA